jgi:hypothetical protein
MNVIGKMKVRDFNERAPFYDKFDEVTAAIGVKADWSTRPYSSMKHAKEFRDTIAHGKPEYEEFDSSLRKHPLSTFLLIRMLGNSLDDPAK